MIGFSGLKAIFEAVLQTGLVNEVFHSVIIRDDGKGHKKPSAPVETKFEYVGIDDSKGFRAYCRAVSPLEPLGPEERLGGCGHSVQRVRVINRLVFFSPNESRGHDDLTAAFYNAVLSVPGIRLSRLYTNAEDFLRQEQPTGTFNLSPKDYYIAIDFSLSYVINANDCQPEQIGCGIKNPFCK